jgi:error-prone DNA polymerase
MLNVSPTAELPNLKNGDKIKVAGLVTVRQRPGTAKGILFITIEDETGFANLVAWEKIFDKYRKDIVQARLLMVEGVLQIEGKVIHVIIRRCFNLSKLLSTLTTIGNDDQPVMTLSRSDETTAPYPAGSNKGQVQQSKQKEVFHKGRNFK